MSRPVLVVVPGGRNQSEVIQVERRTWDETRVALHVSRSERVTHAHQQHRLLSAALGALFQVEPDVSAAERFITAGLRLVIQEGRRAAADVEGDHDPEAVAA